MSQNQIVIQLRQRWIPILGRVHGEGVEADAAHDPAERQSDRREEEVRVQQLQDGRRLGVVLLGLVADLWMQVERDERSN